MQTTLDLLPITNARVSYLDQLAFDRSTDEVLADLIEQTDWKSQDVVVNGKTFKQPRLTAWYGDPGMNYSYSGLSLQPNPWTPLLREIKDLV